MLYAGACSTTRPVGPGPYASYPTGPSQQPWTHAVCPGSFLPLPWCTTSFYSSSDACLQDSSLPANRPIRVSQSYAQQLEQSAEPEACCSQLQHAEIARHKTTWKLCLPLGYASLISEQDVIDASNGGDVMHLACMSQVVRGLEA